MKVSRLESYRLVEGNEHFTIMPARNRIAGTHELIISDMRGCLIYIERYLNERADGKAIQQAHVIALKGAQPTFPRG